MLIINFGKINREKLPAYQMKKIRPLSAQVDSLFSLQEKKVRPLFVKDTTALLGILTVATALLLCAQAKAQSFLTNGLVAYYPLNGNARDASGNGNDGTLVGNVGFTNGLFGQALSDNGGFVSVPSNPDDSVDPSGVSTFSIWTYQTTFANSFQMFEKRGCDGNYNLGFTDNSTYNLLEWIQTVIVSSNGVSSFYSNGVFQDSCSCFLGPTNSAPLEIGGADSCGQPFPGLLEKFRIYNRALSAAEVQELFDYESQMGLLITWTNPAPIAYGTPLDTNELDAVANIPGTFVYNPPPGTVLDPGTNILSAVFTPTDAVDYSVVTNTVSLVVSPMAPAAPSFIRQPASQTVSPGQPVTFTALATGYPPPSYQWQFNGTNINGATSTNYTIPSTSLTNLGFYDVVIANSAGTNNSASVSLMFLNANQINVHSTGVDDANNLLPPGSRDAHYVIISAPAGTETSPFAPYVIPPNQYPFPYWLTNDAVSQWVAVQSNYTSATQDPAGLYDYQTSFDLTGFDPSTASLTFTVIADNLVQDVRLNGVSAGLAIPPPSSFALWQGPYTVSNNFVSGTNVLDFIVNNTPPDGGNPSGLRVEISGIASNTAPILSIYPAVEIVWNSRTNVSYQVQWRTNLLSTNWFNLGAVIPGTGNPISTLDSTRNSATRFYRVVVEP